MRELIGMILIPSQRGHHQNLPKWHHHHVKLTFQEVLYEEMIFCHYMRRIKMVPGGLGHVQKKLVIFVHHFPNLHTKSFIEDRVNRLHRHLRFENLQFQVYIRNQQDHQSLPVFFVKLADLPPFSSNADAFSTMRQDEHLQSKLSQA